VDEVLDNAVRFSPNGGVISISVRGIPPHGKADIIEVAVTDAGIGIEEKDVPRIFSDFQQLDGSITRSYGGLGLGLSFVHRIIEAHDGAVRVDSSPGRGTTFTLAIPAPSDEA
jgi:signal transduction histidine kinase